MGFAAKAVRKLGLSDTAARLLAPLAADHTPLPDAAEAEALLTAKHPDRGCSALFEAPLPPADERFDVDVIIPVYNAEKYLDACLDSALAPQGAYRVHIIAVDAGSAGAVSSVLSSNK